MVPQDLPEWFIKKAKTVTAKRAKTVIDHILKHGHITTEELKTQYGYDHPPRAARDVREQGIPLETFRIAGTQHKSIAAYRFADPSLIRSGALSGRKVFSKEFKALLVVRSGCKCGVCLTEYEARYLQVDHRVPYEVGGEGGGESAPDEFQLICGSCNRAKSWSCEHCTNGTNDKQVKVCRTCYWASPKAHKHVALRPIRRLDVTWTGEETSEFDQLAQRAKKANQPLPEFVKAVLRKRGL
ncbi:MAG: HNH endonuclease [Pirellulaceae bacterium]|nr:HNH endonuclease [Pirellulaceae bacterium]